MNFIYLLLQDIKFREIYIREYILKNIVGYDKSINKNYISNILNGGLFSISFIEYFETFDINDTDTDKDYDFLLTIIFNNCNVYNFIPDIIKTNDIFLNKLFEKFNNDNIITVISKIYNVDDLLKVLFNKYKSTILEYLKNYSNYDKIDKLLLFKILKLMN